jgi:hypothetical protein
MQREQVIKKGKDEMAVVRRIVPGKLVYVETKPEKIYALKLDKLVIRKRDGSCYPYRGEPLSELGVNVGRKVVVWGFDHDDTPPTLVIDADGSTTIGSALSQVAAKAVEYFKR